MPKDSKLPKRSMKLETIYQRRFSILIKTKRNLQPTILKSRSIKRRDLQSIGTRWQSNRLLSVQQCPRNKCAFCHTAYKIRPLFWQGNRTYHEARRWDYPGFHSERRQNSRRQTKWTNPARTKSRAKKPA